MHQDKDVVEHCGSNAEKSVTKQADFISEGDITVDPSQHDITGTLPTPPPNLINYRFCD